MTRFIPTVVSYISGCGDYRYMAVSVADLPDS
jgi:hypothetical protein